jgi:transcription initiation factor TFIIIB Brf1 subunit/transcription initiation factor TFIIB
MLHVVIQMAMKVCPECGSIKVKLTANEYTCQHCGLVIDQPFFSGSRVA